MTPQTGSHRPADSLESFLARVGALLTHPASAQPARIRSSLFPPEEPPDLLIFAGGLQPGQLRELRDQLPARSFLLALYPAGESAPEEPPALERTLVGSLGDASAYADKVALLVAVLPERRVRLIVGAGWRERLAEPLRRIEEAILAALDNAQQERNRGLIRLRSSLRNLPSLLANSGLQLRRVPPGTPAVVCGAGPSLPAQLDELRALRGRVVLLAVGHAVATLARAGIEPDVVVEVDAHAGRNWPAGLSCDALLVACTELAPEVAARFSRVWWCAGSSPAFNLAMRQWQVPLREAQLAKTVTVPAVDFAVRLGCSPIVLVGQDFCLAADGTSHADGERLEGGDQVVDRPGNDSPKVASTRNLASLHDAFQSYLRYLNGSFHGVENRPEVVNATLGGARIEGTRRQALAEVLAGRAELDRSVAWWTAGTGRPAPPAELRATEKGIREYAALTDILLETCSKLRADLSLSPVDMSAVRRHQRMLQQMVSNEDAKRCEELPSTWLNPLITHVDTVLKESPGALPSSTEPLAQLDLLTRRFSFIRDLCADLLADFERVLAELEPEAPAGRPAAGSPLAFRGFRGQALRLLERRSPDLAGWLRATAPAPRPAFAIRWLNQYLPYVKYRGADGVEVPLSGLVDMIEQGARDVESFVTSRGFDPALHSVVFAGPGNWVHVLEFAKRFPSARLMVLDPWPDLLAALIERGCFLHVLPADSLVLGAVEALPAWMEQAVEQALAWKAAGLFPLLFAHPRAEALADVRLLTARLQREVWSLL